MQPCFDPIKKEYETKIWDPSPFSLIDFKVDSWPNSEKYKEQAGAELGNNAVNSGHIVPWQRTQPLGPTDIQTYISQI